MGFFIGTMMGALSPILRLRSEAVVPLRFDRDVMKAMLTQGAQYAFGAAVIVFNLRINVLILEQSVPYTQVGLFGNGSNLVEAIWQIPTSIGIVLTGKSANAESVEAAVQQTVKAFRAVFPVTILAGLVMALLAGPITLLFFGEKLKTAGPNAYETAVTCIHLLIPGVLLGVIYKVFGADLVGRGKPLFAAKAYLVALVVNVILSLWLIRVQGMGIIGASIANSISYCVGALLFFRSYQREYHVKLQDAFVPRLSDYRPLLKKLRLAR
jgi:O-antigen/teichoic acid export membrane protein